MNARQVDRQKNPDDAGKATFAVVSVICFCAAVGAWPALPAKVLLKIGLFSLSQHIRLGNGAGTRLPSDAGTSA